MHNIGSFQTTDNIYIYKHFRVVFSRFYILFMIQNSLINANHYSFRHRALRLNILEIEALKWTLIY